MAHHAHDDAHDHHHILSTGMLLKIFGALIFFTVLTVVLAKGERSGFLEFGALSVPIALAIAGAKATIVAMFFMELKYDKGVNALTFSLGGIFLVVFLVFTFLDTGFRDTFEELSATPLDIVEQQERTSQEESEAIKEAFQSQPILIPQDSLIFQR